VPLAVLIGAVILISLVVWAAGIDSFTLRMLVRFAALPAAALPLILSYGLWPSEDVTPTRSSRRTTVSKGDRWAVPVLFVIFLVATVYSTFIARSSLGGISSYLFTLMFGITLYFQRRGKER
jgi:hypothetical protein